MTTTTTALQARTAAAVLCALFIITCAAASFTAGSSYESLVTQVLGEQQLTNRSWDMLPFVRVHARAGLWPSQIHMFQQPDPLQAALREAMGLPDENMFVTAWVCELLLETAMASGDAELLEDIAPAVQRAIDTLLPAYLDHHSPTGAPVMSFWAQELLPSRVPGVRSWQASPRNALAFVHVAEMALNDTANVLAKLGLTKSVWDRFHGPHIAAQMVTFSKAFRIPGDFDDSAAITVIGSLLTRITAAAGDSAPPALVQAADRWRLHAGNINALVDWLNRTAYRPCDPAGSPIDPRSYYVFRRFFQSHPCPTTLIPTWAMRAVDSPTVCGDQESCMPFNVNNVDASVAANMLLALVHARQNAWTNASAAIVVDQLIESNAALVAWCITEGVIVGDNARPDLALLYYPSRFDFYFFAARALAAARDDAMSAKAAAVLGPALMGPGTDQLLGLAHNQTWWEDFLGTGDRSWTGKPVDHGDDRVFSTASAVHALVLTWGADAPEQVAQVLGRAGQWLKGALSDRRPLDGAFFSGSMKGVDDLPYSYPWNTLELWNGTRLSAKGLDRLASDSPIFQELVSGVRGVIPEAQYEAMLNQTWMGMHTPTRWGGYNQPGVEFPYWSSPSLTKASVALALARLEALGYV